MSGQIKTPGASGSCPCGISHDDEDPRRKFYVSVVDGERFNFLDGPFDTHVAALSAVEPTRMLAEKVDPSAHFYAFGTARAPSGYRKPGLLSKPTRRVSKIKTL